MARDLDLFIASVATFRAMHSRYEREEKLCLHGADVVTIVSNIVEHGKKVPSTRGILQHVKVIHPQAYEMMVKKVRVLALVDDSSKAREAGKIKY